MAIDTTHSNGSRANAASAPPPGPARGAAARRVELAPLPGLAPPDDHVRHREGEADREQDHGDGRPLADIALQRREAVHLEGHRHGVIEGPATGPRVAQV